MNRFFVTIFGDQQYYQYRVDEILANSFNGIVSEEYALEGMRFFFPIVIDEGQYCVTARNSDWGVMVNNSAVTEGQKLRNGDFIIVKNKMAKKAVMILAKDYSDCSLSVTLYKLENKKTYYFGRQEDANFVISFSDIIAHKHASLSIDDNGNAVVKDISNSLGIFVNGKKVDETKLFSGDHIYIPGVSFYYYPQMIVAPSNICVNGMKPVDGLKVLDQQVVLDEEPFDRAARIQKHLDDCTIEIDLPPAAQKQKEMPFILTAGPSITMAFGMLVSVGVTISNAISADGVNFSSVITSSVMAVSMLLGALLWPKLSRNYSRRQLAENERLRQEKYSHYLDEKEEEIVSLYNRNTSIWNGDLYPNCSTLIKNIGDKNIHLWERGYKDRDFLGIRLGSGDRPFEVTIAVRKKGFEMEEDELGKKAYQLSNKYAMLRNVPIDFSLLEHRVLGVIGRYEEIAKNIVINLVSLYSPNEVKLIVVYNSTQKREWSWLDNLPHVWSEDKKNRYLATNREEAYSLFGHLEEYTQNREANLSKDDVRTPRFVALIFDQSMIEDLSFSKVIEDSDNDKGVSAIFFGKRYTQIPKECVAVIQNGSESCGVYTKNNGDGNYIEFVPDSISDEDIDKLLDNLAKISVKTAERMSGIPDRLSFMDMYQVGNVEDLDIATHWNGNRSDKSLAAPIGVLAGRKTFDLDIHEKYHGCHGLVAGTTGSGKSEFLQAYILSMMIHYSPNEVAFVLVDFKGGDMARPFLRCPHIAATISNLSANTMYRALVSFEAEVKRRQRIFNNAATDLRVDKIDINSYQRFYKEGRLAEALPHLIIIIDEFAQLKQQHPEFMSKLIDVAQVGRSLGIHLILATQKPNGVVDPQIWSNSRFKVCLKVMDKQDSSDMINRPVAALIKNPGRAYVQVGYDEVFELIQSGYSGADYYPQEKYTDEEENTISLINGLAEPLRRIKDIATGIKKKGSQIEAIVEKIVECGKQLRLFTNPLWCDPLPDALLIDEIIENDMNNEQHTGIVCGKIDLPSEQNQEPYIVDFLKDGHLAIYGSSGMGKSTFIQTIMYQMARKYTIQEFISLVIDFNGGSLLNLAKMPHCIGYVNDENEKDVYDALSLVEDMIAKRRTIFASANCANYESYLKANNHDIPIMVVVLDNYSSFREKMYKCEDLLVQIIASASACGIYFVLTGNSKGAIYYKVTEHINQRVVLFMNDNGSYRDILNVTVPYTIDAVKGRALMVYGKKAVEVQIAVPFEADSEVSRMSQIKEYYEFLTNEQGKAEAPSREARNEYEEIQAEKNEPIYQKQPLNRYSCKEIDQIIQVGKDIDSGENMGFDYSDKNPIAIVDKTNNISILCSLVKKMKENYDVHVYSAAHENLFENEIISDIDQYVLDFSSSQNEQIMVIDGFSQFYDEISNEALDHLLYGLQNDICGKIISYDTFSRIQDYIDTELYLRLFKCHNGLVVGGGADNNLAAMLSNEFYMIPEIYRGVMKEDSQAIIYSGDKATYIQLEDHYE